MDLRHLLGPRAEPEVLGTGYGFTEGPAADAEGNVYFSDGRNNSIYFYAPGASPRLWADDSLDANGMIFSPEGELLVCEGAAHRIVAFDVAGRGRRVLANQIDGVRFNEPNDLAVDRQGGFYFSDPCYGHQGNQPVMKEDVYYVNREGGVARVSTVCVKPNGLVLAPDDGTLYLADNRGEVIYRYDVLGPGRLANETVWAEVGARPDGLTLDEHGNLYACCGAGGVRVFSPDGRSIGVLELDYASNCVFGGTAFSTLLVTSRDKFVALPMQVRGILPRCA